MFELRAREKAFLKIQFPDITSQTEDEMHA